MGLHVICACFFIHQTLLTVFIEPVHTQKAAHYIPQCVHFPFLHLNLKCTGFPQSVFLRMSAGVYFLAPFLLYECEGILYGLRSKHKHQLHVDLGELALCGTAE